MRLVDADALKGPIELQRASYARIGATERAEAYANCLWEIAQAPTIGGWVSADKRPPKQGRYLVWGLTRIAPDHYDEANGFWEIQPAFWFEKSGWDRKVKFWQTLPEPPEEVSGDA